GLLLRGSEQDIAWAHGVVVEDLTAAPALQTFDPRAQDLERQIRRVWSVYEEQPAAPERSAALSARLREIAAELGRAPLTYDEWQIVYRQALQLSRALGGDAQLLEATANGRGNKHRTTAETEMNRPISAARNAREASARELSNRALLGEITSKASLLARKEIELAKTEIRADLQAQLGTVKAFGVAAVAALLGVNLLLVAGVLALGLKIAAWLAALIVGGVLLVTALIAGHVGWGGKVTKPPAHQRHNA